MIEPFDIIITGVPEFDRDHREIALLCRETARQLVAGRRRAATAFARQAFAHLHSHLIREERFLAGIGYPHLAAHRKAKVRLMGAALRFVRAVAVESIPPAALLRQFEQLLDEGLRSVMVTDGAYARHLQERGYVVRLGDAAE